VALLGFGLARYAAGATWYFLAASRWDFLAAVIAVAKAAAWMAFCLLCLACQRFQAVSFFALLRHFKKSAHLHCSLYGFGMPPRCLLGRRS